MPTAWEDWPLGIASGRYDVALINIAVTEKRKRSSICDLPGGLGLLGEIHQRHRRGNGPADIAGRKVIVGSGTNQERILLGWNEDNRAAGRPQAQPVYLTDDASGNLYIQSGRADIFSARSRWQPIKRRLTARPGWWAWGRKSVGGDNHQKATARSMPCRQPSTGRLPAVNISRCWRVGEQGEAVAQSVVNPPGITY